MTFTERLKAVLALFLIPVLVLFTSAVPALGAKGGGGSELAAPITAQFSGSFDPAVSTSSACVAPNVCTFAGTLTISSFTLVGNTIVAVGTITGKVTDALGNVVTTISNQVVSALTTIATSTCTILSLTLGPIDLNILGLMVHTNTIVLTITANPSGGILGQLLCSLAGSGNILSQIVALLNQLLALFGSV